MQEIEEKTKESWRKQTQPETSAYECFFHYTDELLYSAGFKEGLKIAQQWIDVCEELPENNKLVMFKDNMDDIFLGHIENNRYWYAKSVGYGDEEIDYVTHWRYININN